MSNGLYSGQSGLSLGIGLYRYVSGLWSGASGLVTGDGASLYLNFLAGAPLDSRITFTRSSTATFVGSDGLIQTAAVNGPRFDYNPANLTAKGLLIEEQRTNLLLYSAQFNNAAWTKSNSTVTVDATVSPDGTSNADKIVEAATTSIHDVRRNSTASASTAYTQSIFVKAAERTKIQLQMFGNTGGSTVNFDLVAGTVNVAGAYGGWSSSSGTITSFGNGWYRLTNTSTTNVGLTAVTSAFLLADAAGNATYTGNGTSGMFYFGAQLEAGAFATSYIPTVAAQVTRSADIATMTGTNFSSWFNASTGTFVANFEASPNQYATYIAASNGVVGQNSVHFDNDSGGAMRAVYYSGSVAQAILSLGAYGTAGTINTVASAYAVNDFAASRNGGAVVTDTSGALPVSLTQFNIGADPSGAAVNVTNTHIRSIVYYPTRLTDAQLQSLTA